MRRTHRVCVLITLVFVAYFPKLGDLSVARAITIGPPQLVGTINSSVLDEISGIVQSRANANTFWVHNDSGHSAEFHAVSRSGSLLGTFGVDGAASGDWEDISIGPKTGGGNYLYLGDIGDNNARRTNISIHRVVEPNATLGGTILSNQYKTLRLTYPGGARDAESMFVDPISNELYLITKRQAVPEVYSIPTSAFDSATEVLTLTSRGAFDTLPYFATAADISPDGRFILVRSHSSPGYLYPRALGQSVVEALQGIGIPFQLGAEVQGEAIGWATDGKSFFTTSEFSIFPSAPIYAYSFSAPPPLPGDYNDDHVVDAADYAVWRNSFGQDIALPNELETPGAVTSEDYDVWKAHYGQSLAGTAAAHFERVAAVPEPGSLILAFCGALLVVAHRRGAVRRN